MSLDTTRPLRALSLDRAKLQGGLLGTVQERVIEKTLPAIAQKLEQVGVFRALEAAVTGEKVYVHPFWDSDVGKWLEAVSYGMVRVPDLASRLPVERAIRLLAAAQDKSGYLNSYYMVVEPDQRFQQLAFGHELYNAGHLIEGAVAHYEATGRRDFLDIVIRYANHIYDIFGPGKRTGYPGHPEIELALVKLYRVTGDRRYLELSREFLVRRGRKPSIFESEIGRLSPRHEEWFRRLFHLGKRFSTEYCQDHMPVKEQREAVGHAVRAMYLYSGMVDVGVETGDEEFLTAARRLWEDVVTRRMYITGGIGSSEANEGFTGPYDLPNETAYAETCAAIGLVFLSHRLLQIEPDRRYADVMERALYNAVLGGVSLDGAHFAYDTPLACASSHRRQPWFEVACCPPNLARLLLSLGKYVASEGDGELYVHLYVPGEYVAQLAGQAVRLRVETEYPWDGRIRLHVDPEKPGTFAVHCRIPGWVRQASVSVNGNRIETGQLEGIVRANGYARLEREWRPGDRIELEFPMPVERMVAHPAIAADAGRVALQRGPVVYCVEEADTGGPVDDVLVGPGDTFEAEFRPDVLGGVALLRGNVRAVDRKAWEGKIYQPAPGPSNPYRVTAIPFFAWGNRTPGEMRIWLRQG